MAERTLVVEPEDRTLAVAAESRTLSVPGPYIPGLIPVGAAVTSSVVVTAVGQVIYPKLTAGLLGAAEAYTLAATNGQSLSTFGIMSQATGGSQPTYASAQTVLTRADGATTTAPAVMFNGSQWVAGPFGGGTSPQPNTIYIGFAQTATGVPTLFDGYTGLNRHQAYNDTNKLQIYAGGGGYIVGFDYQDNGQALAVPMRLSLYCCVFDEANSRVYRFGVDGGAVSASPGPQGLDGLTLGAYYSGGGLFVTGYVTGILAYSGHHDANTRNEVSAYCYQNWGFNQTKPQVVCDGDSLTVGYLLGSPTTQSYPAQLQSALPGWDVFNDGDSGATTAYLTERFLSVPAALFRPLRQQNILCAQSGPNDILGDAGTPLTPTQVLSEMASYYTQAKAAGFQVVRCTITAANYTTTFSGSATYESSRLSINASLRAASPGTYFDALADVGADSIIGDVANVSNFTYYQGDQLHLTQAGYARWYPYVQAAVNSLT